MVNYDLLVGCKLAETVLATIDRLQPDITVLLASSITDIDIEDRALIDSIGRIYAELTTIQGLWITGASKIAHLLNDRLLPICGLDVIEHFQKISTGQTFDHRIWLKQIKHDAHLVIDDFHQSNHPSDTLEKYLSNKLGYQEKGVTKSVVKYLDEYYWLKYVEKITLPPNWVPDQLTIPIKV